MSGTSGYRSPVNLGLGRVPKSSNPELFDELTEVYNSIHLIASYMDRLRLSIGGGGGQLPDETAPFNRFYTAPALQVITAGDVVCPASLSGQNGIVKGALPHAYNTSAPECNFAGIALNDAAIGALVRVGIGPAAVELPGASPGSFVWAYSSVSTSATYSEAGGLYPSAPSAITGVNGGTVYPVAIGISPLAGYALIDQYVRR